MTEPSQRPDPDTDYLARLRGEHDRQRSRLLSVAPLTLGFSGALAAIAALSMDAVEGAARSAVVVGLIAGIILLIWGLIHFERTQPDEVSLRLAKETDYGEGVQRGRRHAMLFVFIPMGGLMPMAMGKAHDLASGRGDASDWMMAVTVLVGPALSVLILTGREGGITPRLRRHVDDEQTRVARRRAMAFGFHVMLVCATGLYGVGLWRPEVAITLMPLALWAGALAAAGRFALLERAAERGDDHG